MTVATPSTSVTIQLESVRVFWQQAMPLFVAHLAEMPHLLDEPLDLDREGYERAEDRGLLRCYMARLNGELIGYGVFFVHPHLWHRGRIDAGQHALYVVPEYRRGFVGVRLIRFIERALRAEGVRVCRQHAHPGRREGRLFEREGYTLAHLEYEKRLN